jgi:hypothetical protein
MSRNRRVPSTWAGFFFGSVLLRWIEVKNDATR